MPNVFKKFSMIQQKYFGTTFSENIFKKYFFQEKKIPE
jgi:hypothetical protein